MRNPDTFPPILPGDVTAIELLEKARKTGSVADGDAAMAAVRNADEHLPLSDFRFLFPMALGRMDAAFASPDVALVGGPEASALTLPFLDRLRRDPRFWPLAAKAGLVRYWLASNKWPDFCSDPTYPLDCHAEAKKVASIKPT